MQPPPPLGLRRLCATHFRKFQKPFPSQHRPARPPDPPAFQKPTIKELESSWSFYSQRIVDFFHSFGAAQKKLYFLVRVCTVFFSPVSSSAGSSFVVWGQSAAEGVRDKEFGLLDIALFCVLLSLALLLANIGKELFFLLTYCGPRFHIVEGTALTIYTTRHSPGHHIVQGKIIYYHGTADSSHLINLHITNNILVINWQPARTIPTSKLKLPVKLTGA